MRVPGQNFRTRDQTARGHGPLLHWFKQYYFFFVGRFHPATVTCLLRDKVSSPSGALRVIVEPAPIVAPLPTVTGATNCVFEPMNTSSSMMVRCLFAPS